MMEGEVASAAPSVAPIPAAAPTGMRLDAGSLASLPVDAQVEALAPRLRGFVEEVLALDANTLGERDPLDAVGFDSLAAVDLQIRIAKVFWLTPSALPAGAASTALRIVQQVKPAQASTPPAAPAPVEQAPARRPRKTSRRGPFNQPRELTPAAPGLLPGRARLIAPPATHTNSYALGGRDVVLVEPATPFESEHSVDRGLRGLAASGGARSRLQTFHHHDDHVGGLEVLARELKLPVWMHRETQKRVGAVPPGRLLDDGETLRLDGPVPEEWHVLHTPGHAPGHLCLWNAAIFYRSSPETWSRATGRSSSPPATATCMPTSASSTGSRASIAAWRCPAHGDPIAAPTAMFRRYIQERETREMDVLGALGQVGALGGTPENLVPIAYSDAPPHTWPFGLLTLRAHLEKLLREGRVVENDGVYRACG